MTQVAAAPYRPLGAFRFGLAMLVVLQHFQHLLPQDERALFSHMGFGAIAVACFFAVSGFVVAEAIANFYGGRPGAFLMNRAVRLVPPYLAALALSIFVHAVLWYSGRLVLWDYTLTGSPLAPARLLSGLCGLVPGFNPRLFGQDFEFIPFVWTLRLEVAFYLAVAAVVGACVYLRAAWPIGAGMVAGIVASAAFLVLARRPGILDTVPMFLVGGSLFLLERRPGWCRAAMLLVSLIIAAAGFAAWRQHGEPVLAWQFPLLGVLIGLFTYLATRRQGLLPRGVDGWLGELSYPLYLNHYVAGIVAGSLGAGLGFRLYVAAVAGAVVIAIGSSRVVDRRLRPLRDRIRKRTL